MTTLKSNVDYAIDNPEDRAAIAIIVDRLKESEAEEAIEVIGEMIRELSMIRRVIDDGLRFDFITSRELGTIGREGCERTIFAVTIEDIQEAIAPGSIERGKESLRYEIFGVLRKKLKSNRWYALRLEETQVRTERMIFDRREQVLRLEAIYRPLSRT